MKNKVFDRFLDNWMSGGAKTREAFMRDLLELLQAERDRCTWEAGNRLIEIDPRASEVIQARQTGWDDAVKAIHTGISELT